MGLAILGPAMASLLLKPTARGSVGCSSGVGRDWHVVTKAAIVLSKTVGRTDYSWLPGGWTRGGKMEVKCWLHSKYWRPQALQPDSQRCLPYGVPFETCRSPMLRLGGNGILTLGIMALGEAYLRLRTQNLHLPLSPSEADEWWSIILNVG